MIVIALKEKKYIFILAEEEKSFSSCLISISHTEIHGLFLNTAVLWRILVSETEADLRIYQRQLHEVQISLRILFPLNGPIVTQPTPTDPASGLSLYVKPQILVSIHFILLSLGS